MSDNRIAQTTLARTGARQTPQNEFGAVLADTVNQGIRIGAAALGAATGSPVVSAAVSGIANAVTSRSAVSLPGGGSPAAGSGGTGAVGGAGGSSAMEMLQMQAAMQAEGMQMNVAYLGLQREMQRESREYTALSNIMKVRHDSAKAAINNVR